LGLTTWRQFRREGVSLHTYADTRSDFVHFATNYRTWREFVTLSKRHGLRISYRSSGELYTQKLRASLGRRLLQRYRTPRRPLQDWMAFMVARYLLTVTLCFDKPARPDPWRDAGGVAEF
jgi:hypothetical protein